MKSNRIVFSLFIILFIILFFILSDNASSQYYKEYEQDYLDGDTSDSYYVGDEAKIIDWYEVSDEEIEFCQGYAGTEEAESYYGALAAGFTEPVSKLTLTAQGEYSTLYDKRLYEFGWYVHPAEEDIVYVINLIDEEGDREELFTGYATAIDGDAGYEAIESDSIYEYVEIVLEDGTSALQVPIVEKINI